VAADTVRIDLIKFRGKACMLPSTLQGKDVDAGRQSMARRMALGAIDLGMHIRLLPKRRFSLLMVTGDAEFFLGRGIGGKGDSHIKGQDR
jgi:hypothetical protein